MPRVARGRWVAEGLLVIALVILAFWYGRFASSHASSPPDYHYLSPAIAVAAGKGFHGAVAAPGTPLHAFLARQSATLDWAEAERMTIGPPDRFHETTRYLINLVGYWWRVTGISWESLGVVGAGFHAMAVAGSYLLIRLFLPLPLAILGALWICTSTVQLALVPHVRDYSKGAFIICLVPLIAMLVLKPLSPRARLATAAAAGALAGYGLGFKMDVAIMVPLALACIVLLRGRRPWTDLLDKAQVAGVFLAAFFLAAGPLLYRLSAGGANSFHVVLLGFTDGFDANLGIDRSVYAFLPFYSDGYVASVVQGHAGAVLDLPSPAYDAAGRALFLDIARNFPADLFVRGLGAANAVMNLLFLSRDPSFLTEPLPLQSFFVAMYSALYRLEGLGILLAAAFVLVASWGNVRRGMFAALVMLVLAGYPSLQFESRHYFHAQIVPVVAFLSVGWAIVRHGLSWKSLGAAAAERPAIAAAVGVMVALTLVPLAVLRVYQGRHVRTVFTKYLDTRVPLQSEVIPEANGSVLVRWPQTSEAIGALRDAHYVVEFADDGNGEPIHVAIRYDASPAQDYSRVLTLSPRPGPNRVGFSVFATAGQSDFAGIELGESARRRLSGVFRVDAGGPAGLPLDVRLPADWSGHHLYQRLRLERWSPLEMPSPPVTRANGPGCRGLLGYLDRLPAAALAITPEAIGMVHSDTVRPAAASVLVDGPAENESSYLFQLKEHTTTGKALFVAEGYLTEGGIAVGLLKQRVWYKQAIVQNPGPFVVAVPVDDPGSYIPLVTNAMPPGRRASRLTITRAGFMDPVAPKPPGGEGGAVR